MQLFSHFLESCVNGESIQTAISSKLDPHSKTNESSSADVGDIVSCHSGRNGVQESWKSNSTILGVGKTSVFDVSFGVAMASEQL